MSILPTSLVATRVVTSRRLCPRTVTPTTSADGMDSSLAVVIGFGTRILGITIRTIFSERRLPLPPGPAQWPVVGNLFDIPKVRPWLTYHQWAKTYGEILSLNAMGKTVVVLNSARVARDLFEKDALKYSDRPQSVVATELGANSNLYDSLIRYKRFPLAGFRKKMIQWREEARSVLSDPYNYVRDEMSRNSGHASALSVLLAKCRDSKYPDKDDDAARHAMASIYMVCTSAGVDTVAVDVNSMTLHPEKQRKAQAELDRVVGRNRLPDSSDRPNLPYVNAVMKETTLASSNPPRAVLHDPLVYSDPEESQPERFIKDGQLVLEHKDPTALFGSLRDCTAIHMVSHLLAAFTIDPALDGEGKERQLDAEMSSDMIS
ncbi:cytochrome P450 [Neolentinus lepideus HHB14362 ss-1]|uniref:Cytochrome P450 n=1 Tax=Neolentinus lepideus HHB14362 ss-1 TaxID=1314782 RepID=A0A165MNW2_9AGAM|nr:cytochrome P450 [Neolentinus lepideus HHB14362 ss-1]